MLLGFLVIVLSKVDVRRQANFKAFLKTMACGTVTKPHPESLEN